MRDSMWSGREMTTGRSTAINCVVRRVDQMSSKASLTQQLSCSGNKNSTSRDDPVFLLSHTTATRLRLLISTAAQWESK